MMLDQEAVMRVVVLMVLIVGFQVVVSRIALERESKRRWQHALTGHCLVQASYLIPLMPYGIAGLLLAAVGMAWLKLKQPDAFQKAFGPLLRPNELEAGQMPGAFYFLLGTALTAFWFDLSTARYAVECLALADPMAAFAGKSIASPKINASASVAGCVGCFATAWVIGYVMLEDVSLGAVSVGALACTLAESIPFGNDNMTIPLVTAAAVHLFR